MKSLQKTKVICHMMSTVDGRIIGDNWGSARKMKTFSDLYEQCHAMFKSQAWMVGRVTMEQHFAKGRRPKVTKSKRTIERKPFIADETATSFAIAIDGKGKLHWKDNNISGDHIVEILTEKVSNAYLHYLQQKGISYLFAGKDDLDLNLALLQLGRLFPIKTIMLEGGGHINGSLLNEGLIDELSLLIVPVADGTPNTPTTFEVGEYLQKKSPRQLHLSGVKKMEAGVVWLKYNFT